MSDNASNSGSPIPTLQQLLSKQVPIGDLKRFVIADLTAEEEDAFYRIIADA